MPKLIIIAGCNGAGKSTFASSFLPDGLVSFDYDKLYLEYYNGMPDSEFRDKFALDRTTQDFENAIKNALNKELDFCYETNFDMNPIYWAEKFKEKGFTIDLIFFCLNSQDIARLRVAERTEFKGHFVDNLTIDLKWKAGYKNFNMYFKIFDNILVVDNSIQKDVYKNILQIEQGEIILMTEKIPEYFKHRLPEIYNMIKN
jgi:predicted ABC-type ATPase